MGTMSNIMIIIGATMIIIFGGLLVIGALAWLIIALLSGDPLVFLGTGLLIGVCFVFFGCLGEYGN